MVVELQTRLHAIVAAELEEGEAFRRARLFVRAVADGGGRDFGEVSADGVRGGREGEVAFAAREMQEVEEERRVGGKMSYL